MCHSIVWYYALCQHLNEAHSLTITCDSATISGYDCLPIDQPILSLPLSGACDPCKHEHRKEAYTMQTETAELNEVEIEAAAGTETGAGDETNSDAQAGNDKRDSGDEDDDDTTPDPDPIPGYHTHLYPQLDGYIKKKSNWESLEEIDVEDGHEESQERCESSFFLDDEESLVSSPVSEKWCEKELDAPDSPTLGCVTEKWRSASLPCPSTQRKSKIPVPSPSDDVTKRHNTWNTYELELFDQVTF